MNIVMKKCSEIDTFPISRDLTLDRREGSDVHFDIIFQGVEIGSASIWDDKCVFWNLTIYPPYRGQGYGKKAYQFIENVFYQDRCDVVRINAVSEATSFWEDLGFQKTSDYNWVTREMIKKVDKGKKLFECQL